MESHTVENVFFLSFFFYIYKDYKIHKDLLLFLDNSARLVKGKEC